MKIYISADIEGITGVTHWDETDISKEDSRIYREQMTAEVAAACDGALQGGATEIWVKDAHHTGRNIYAANLPLEVRLIRGWSGHPFAMLQELDETFKAILLIGYHSRAGIDTSPLAHTMHGGITTIRLNDRHASEFLFAAYTAGYFKIPLAFVSGDQGLCDEIAQFNPHIRTLAVKSGKGDSTVSIHPKLATEKIRQGVAQALGGELVKAQVELPGHFHLEVRYRDHPRAYLAGFYPGARQKDSHTVEFESDNYFDILRYMMFAL